MYSELVSSVANVPRTLVRLPSWLSLSLSVNSSMDRVYEMGSCSSHLGSQQGEPCGIGISDVSSMTCSNVLDLWVPTSSECAFETVVVMSRSEFPVPGFKKSSSSIPVELSSSKGLSISSR